MNKRLFTYLTSYSSDPIKVNRLIVSAFLYSRNILSVTNIELNENFIRPNDADYEPLQLFLKIQKITEFEQLIEIFEFVISPEDKIVNGAIYTPHHIREYVVDTALESVQLSSELKICDPACGCAGFLFTVSKKLKKETNLSYFKIFANNIYGLDIEEFSIQRSKLLLLLLSVSEGEDSKEFKFNLHLGNALNFNWSNEISEFNGFDIVVGNPPYVCSRNMDQKSLDLLDNWSVAKSGHPDLYIPFFQLGYESLKNGGVLGFITVNTFIKSVNGRSLRQYFSENKTDLTIINFGGEQVFHGRNTYTCLCFLNRREGGVRYKKTLTSRLMEIRNSSLNNFEYQNLNDHDGWNLVDSLEQTEYINNIEAIGKPFKELYTTRNGIATLKNHIYKFFPVSEDKEYYYFKTKNARDYKVEKGICRDIVNPNKARTPEQIKSNKEKIIFPYQQKLRQTLILQEQVFMTEYPFAYQYLLEHKETLSTRDKGKKEYENWYAYGRRQSLDINAYKLFFPHLSERPTFTISLDKELLFYNGIAVVSESLRELQVLKRIMESDVFFDYIKNITKDYSSGYISMSKNYIKNFGIPELTVGQENELLTTNDPEELIQRCYGLNVQEYLMAESEEDRENKLS